MTHKIFLSKNGSESNLAEFSRLWRETLVTVFPGLRFMERVGGGLDRPNSFFLDRGEEVLWVEVASVPFLRNEVCHYVARAREVQSRFQSGVSGVLMAPDFEPGVRELLELAGLPIRFFRYHQAVSLVSGAARPGSSHEQALWIEELNVSTGSGSATPNPPPNLEKQEAPLVEDGLRSSNVRLMREELREFIQLELDVASRKYNKS